MRESIVVAALALFLAGCEGKDVVTEPLLTPAQAVETRQDREVALTLVHGCTGEAILFTGGLHERYTTDFDSKGGLHLGIHINPQGLSGVGKDGTQYVANGTYTERLLSRTGGTETLTVNSSLHIVGQGSDNNFRMHELLHITVAADGSVSSTVSETTTTCL